MPRYRTSFAVGIAVGLVAAACGGGEDITPVENEIGSHLVDLGVPQATVQVGDRFRWCADLARGWAEFDTLREASGEADRKRREADEAVESASDDLDLAETRQALEAATERSNSVRRAYSDALDDATRQVLNAHRLATGQTHTDDETFAVASERAWEAFLEQSPETKAEAAEVDNGESDWDHPLWPSIRTAIVGGPAWKGFRDSFSESCA